VASSQPKRKTIDINNSVDKNAAGGYSNFTLVRKSQPLMLSASLISCQKRPGDSEHDGPEEESGFYDRKKSANLLSRPTGRQTANLTKLPIHHNPYESFPESVVINRSKASTDSMNRHQHYYYSASSGKLEPANYENSQNCELLESVNLHHNHDLGSMINTSDFNQASGPGTRS